MNNVDRRTVLGLGGAGAIAAAAGLTYAVRAHSGHTTGTEAVQTGHLLRRAGFAPSPTELSAASSAGVDATLDRLLHPEQVDDSVLANALSAQAFDLSAIADLRRWWLLRMAGTKRPLVEKMTLFWHGVLTSDARKVGRGNYMYTQNEFLRAHALGSLRDLLIGISKDGAMLRFLDGHGSNKAHPNENYAREFMELFTMGVGNYTQEDVTAAARALTGWYVTTEVVGFLPNAHDSGVKTFLGHTGNLGLTDVVDIVLAHPATPHYLARRMWTFFAYPDPSDADLAPVIGAFHSSKANIASMVEAVFRSPAFFSAKAYRALVKSPVELVAGLARQLALPIGIEASPATEAMGQALFAPPSVAGWPGGPAWLSTGAWMARMRYLLARSHNPEAQAQVATVVPGRAQPSELVDALIATMLDQDVSADTRSAIQEHAASLTGSPALPGEVAFLVAATPEYQLA